MAMPPTESPERDRSVEASTRAFYDSVGWVADDRGVVGEDKLFRHAGAEFAAYRDKIAAKPGALLGGGGTLLLAGPGDLPASHVKAAAAFDRVVCVDLSERSLEICKRKLGAKGEYHQASLLDLPFADASVDAALCAHVIYHIDERQQRRAVSELIRVTKPGGRIVVVYSNPTSPLMLVQRFLKLLQVNRMLGKNKLYFHPHPLSWWRQFSASASIELVPDHPISSNQAKALLPLSVMRRAFYGWAAQFEETHPKLAVRLWSYVAIRMVRQA